MTQQNPSPQATSSYLETPIYPDDLKITQTCHGQFFSQLETPSMCTEEKEQPYISSSDQHITSFVETPVDSKRIVVWLPVKRTSNNLLSGPVFLVYETPIGLELKATGNLKAPTLNIEVSYWRINARDVFGFTSTECLPSSTTQTCKKNLQLFLKKKDRLISGIFITQQGKCSSSQIFHLQTKTKLSLDRSQVELHATIEKKKQTLLLNEQLHISNFQPIQGTLSSKTQTRTILSTIEIGIQGDFFIMSKPSIFQTFQNP